jgi:tetratricopeptide (TPR) repeat protein
VHLLRPLALIALFAFAGRGLERWSPPVETPLDCNHEHHAAVAVATLERCLDLHPDDVELLTQLGAAYEEAADWGRAEAAYRRAVDIDPDDGDVRVRLGLVLLARGDRAGARREAQAATRLQPGRPAPLDLMRRAVEAPMSGHGAATSTPAAIGTAVHLPGRQP